MSDNQPLTINIICRHYRIEPVFIEQLEEVGLLEIEDLQGQKVVPENQISRLDRMVRIHHDLEVNPQGIDVVLNLLDRIEALEQSLNDAMNRLSIHE